MADISTLGFVAFIIRVIGSIFFFMVLATQVKLRFNNTHDELNHYRDLLIALTSVPLLFNFIAMFNNFVRFTNGQQSEPLNSISFVLGAVASTATAIVLWLLYKKR